jgi:hypothetical protein
MQDHAGPCSLIELQAIPNLTPARSAGRAHRLSQRCATRCVATTPRTHARRFPTCVIDQIEQLFSPGGELGRARIEGSSEPPALRGRKMGSERWGRER